MKKAPDLGIGVERRPETLRDPAEVPGFRGTRWVAHLLCVFVLILCLAAPAVAGKKRPIQQGDPSNGQYPDADNPLVREMLRHLGVQYRRGGSGPGGVDCSGYVGLVYRNAYGLTLPHHSASLYTSSDLERVPLDDLETGDLLFFTTSIKGKTISHVGIYLSEGKFVHATTGKGVIVSSLDEQYYSRRIAGARRVGLEPSSLSGDDTVGLKGDAFSAHVQGIRFGREIRPFPWIVLTPSLSYFDHAGDLGEKDLPKRSLGLDLSLGSDEDKWRISSGLRYLSLMSLQAYAKEEGASKGIDMSLRYSRRLSDGLSISLVGERLQRYQAPVSESGQRMFEEQRVSILFNFSY